MAAVHCVIIGFAINEITPKLLFEYEDVRGDPQQVKVANLNPYLVDAPDVTLKNRSSPICQVPRIVIGNKPIDGGNYLFTEAEKAAYLEKEPQAAPYFHRWLGGDEFLNGYHRYCLWLGECSPSELRAMPQAIRRIEAVRQFRKSSKSAPTQKLADTPTRFHVERLPDSNYLIVPKVSSEKRLYIPIGFETPSTMCSDLVFLIPEANLYHFGVLQSLMHNAWTRAVCGRLESRYRYSAGVVYNNFPWPVVSTKSKIELIEQAANNVLNVRQQYPDSSLADLYNPITMPPKLLKAHQILDRHVDAAYSKRKFKSEAARVAFLFELYQSIQLA